MRKIICWLFGHSWTTYWAKEIRFQKGMKTFRYKHCTKCSKTIIFDIKKAGKSLPPLDYNQKTIWHNYCKNFTPSTTLKQTDSQQKGEGK